VDRQACASSRARVKVNMERECTWRRPPLDRELSRENVHVWQAALDYCPLFLRELEQTLSPDEKARAARFYFERDRDRFIAGRGLLRMILSRYLKVDPCALQFAYGPYGKPELLQPSLGDPVRFNLSHASGLALFAVTRSRRIGIDVEQLRQVQDLPALIESSFSKREQLALRGRSTSEMHEAFLRAWVRKEAYVKATGEGLNQPLNQVEVTLEPAQNNHPLEIVDGKQETPHWLLRDLVPTRGFVAAIAVEGVGWDLQCWQWA
jgi:4'-phosphopantetheinyl transferase